MKAIYIKPMVEKMKLNTDMDLLWAEYADEGGQSHNVGTANEDIFFDEEEMDDDYDPFFDE